ncbi:MAG: endonuclease/exonuclease/phosphatase family protein [Marinilabiliaceae bacterium]|nr:endonuclease/exonuclease/phosphatase family protein [Marinilabiliaceae bacterium]
MKKLFRSISFFITLFLALSLLVAAATAYISPLKLKIFTLVGFGFSALWITNLINLVWQAIRKRWWLFISLGVLILTINHWNNTFQMFSKKTKNEYEIKNRLKILSYNVHMFDYYGGSGSNETPDNFYDFVLTQDPDIICFQEFYSNVTKPKHTPSYIMSRFKQYSYKHIQYFRASHSGSGMATFSKYPFADKGEIRFEQSRNMSIYTDINLSGTIVRVINCHLHTTGIIADDIDAIDNLDFRMDDIQKRKLKRITSKLNKSAAIRAKQAEIIAEHIKNSPYPVIVCGDFNDTPVSYVYRTVRGNLKDAFRGSRTGFGGTYNGKLPSFRIDYILFSPQFESYNFTKFNFGFSDHFPIMTTIELNN